MNYDVVTTIATFGASSILLSPIVTFIRTVMTIIVAGAHMTCKRRFKASRIWIHWRIFFCKGADL